MVAVSNVYNHLSTQLVPKKRNTTHKSSELKAVYNNMAKYNKNSPLYLVNLSDAKQSQIIHIKEAAMTLKDTISTFSDFDSSLYSKKAVSVDDDSTLRAALQSNSTDGLPDNLMIEVSELAREQVNTGTFMESDALDIVPKKHSFTVSTANDAANFSITVTGDDTNLDVQNRVANYINNRGLDVHASLIREGGNSALMLSSVETGISDAEDGLSFHVTSNSTGQNLVELLGMNNVSVYPANSTFSINGEEHHASTNHISINKALELDFYDTSEKPVTVSLIPDATDALEQLDAFVEAYNSLVDLSASGNDSKIGTRNLLNDVSGIVKNHKSELEAAGLVLDENNRLVKNDELLTSSIQSGDFRELFSDMSTFKQDVTKATDRLTLDPMAYINKLIVTYPNRQDKFSTPYNQSLYSGLMYNNYA